MGLINTCSKVGYMDSPVANFSLRFDQRLTNTWPTFDQYFTNLWLSWLRFDLHSRLWPQCILGTCFQCTALIDIGLHGSALIESYFGEECALMSALELKKWLPTRKIHWIFCSELIRFYFETSLWWTAVHLETFCTGWGEKVLVMDNFWLKYLTICTFSQWHCICTDSTLQSIWGLFMCKIATLNFSMEFRIVAHFMVFATYE